jgi:hypothetical protein
MSTEDEKKTPMFFVVSDEMFERVTARARAIAEEQFRRTAFDTRPEALDPVREELIEQWMDDYLGRLGERLRTMSDEEQRRAERRQRRTRDNLASG